MRNYSKSSKTKIIIISLLALVLLGLSIYWVYVKNTRNSTTSSNVTTSKQNSIDEPVSQPQTSEKYLGYRQYTNAKYGLSFYYPASWKIELRDTSTAFDTESTELNLWILDPKAQISPEAVIVTVVAKNINKTTPMEGNNDKYQQVVNINDHHAIKYTFPQSAKVDRLMYYFAVGEKTYTVETINESENVARTPTYYDVFNVIVNSLKITRMQ